MQITNQKTQEVPPTDYKNINSKKTENKDFSVESNGEIGRSKVLEYYNKICDKYPQISFRISDITKLVAGYNEQLGYYGKSHQRGENYSVPGQCSIEIDAVVIKKMQKDKEYEAEVIKYIEHIEKDYPLFEEDTKKQGFENTGAFIFDDEGKASYGTISCHGLIASADQKAEHKEKNYFN